MIHVTHRFFGFLFMSVLFTLGVSGCTKTSDEKLEDAKQNVVEEQKDLQQAQNTYAAEWTTYKTQSQQRIAENRKAIADARAKATPSKTRTKKQIEAELAAIEKRNEELEDELDKYDDGESGWEKFKQSFEGAVDTVGTKIRNFFDDPND